MSASNVGQFLDFFVKIFDLGFTKWDFPTSPSAKIPSEPE